MHNFSAMKEIVQIRLSSVELLIRDMYLPLYHSEKPQESNVRNGDLHCVKEVHVGTHL